MSAESISSGEKSTETRFEEALKNASDLKTSLTAIVREVGTDVNSISVYHGIHVGQMIPLKTSFGRNAIDLKLDAFESKWGMSELFAKKEKTGTPIDRSAVILRIIDTLSKVASRRLVQLLISSPAEQRPALLQKWLGGMRGAYIGLIDIYDRDNGSVAFMSYLEDFTTSTMLEMLKQIEGGQTEVDRTNEVVAEKIQSTI